VGEESRPEAPWITFTRVAVVGCHCQNSTVHLEANDPHRTTGKHGRLVATSSNFTHNRVFDSGAAVYLDQSAALIFQFAHLESNSNRNTLTLGMCDVSAQTLTCLVVVNNTARGVGGGNIPGLIFSPDSYSFENGIFVRNQVDYFLAGNALVFFKKCIIDTDIIWTGAVAIDLIGCVTSFGKDDPTPPRCPFEFDESDDSLIIGISVAVAALIVVMAVVIIVLHRQDKCGKKVDDSQELRMRLQLRSK
jgi:hypothetical protein